MPTGRDTFRATFSFKMGTVFPADDRMARYVMRLSIALGDLRIAAHYATRSRQRSAERLYFVRLTISHLREIVTLLDPPDRTIVPDVEEFLQALPRGTTPSRRDIRVSHASALRKVVEEMPGRPDLAVDEMTRAPRLRDDLKRLRNQFFHYGHNASGDRALRTAMEGASGKRSSYAIRESTMRARYADLIGAKLAHPFDVELTADMHKRIVDLIGPVSKVIHQVEAAWFDSRPPGVVTVVLPGGVRRPLRAA